MAGGLAAQHPLRQIGPSASGRLDLRNWSSPLLGLLLGLNLGLRDNYYTLPKRELSIQEIFIHPLDSAWESSQKLFSILFYLKNKDKLVDIDHPMMKDLKAVLQGERLRGDQSR